MTTRAASLIAIFAAAIASSAAAQTPKGTWKCTAPALKNSDYQGGATAYIHLQAYSSGGYYPVTKNGNVATGVTKDGTKFTCKLS